MLSQSDKLECLLIGIPRQGQPAAGGVGLLRGWPETKAHMRISRISSLTQQRRDMSPHDWAADGVDQWQSRDKVRSGRRGERVLESMLPRLLRFAIAASWW